MRYTPENTVKAGKFATVYLDGVEVNNVIEADTEQGYVVRCLVNGKGYFYADERDEVATERLEGKVVVELRTAPDQP